MRTVNQRTTEAPANSLANRNRTVRIGQVVLPYAVITPAMLLIAVFTFYPTFYMIYVSFFEYNFFSMKFVGLRNYYQLFFINIDFWHALKNTAIYTVLATLCVLGLATVFAVYLQKSTVVNGIAQRLMFLPYLCSGVTIAMVWSWLMDTEGLLNVVLNFFNLPALRWLNDSATSLMSVIIVSIWKSLGYYALIMLSSVKSIPTELLEAAELDDAGKLRTFFKIQLPILSPQLFFLGITITMNSFKVFDIVRLMTGGGPGNSSDVLVYYIYRQAMEYNRYGLGCAAGVVLMIFLGILSIFYFKIMAKRVHYQ